MKQTNLGPVHTVLLCACKATAVFLQSEKQRSAQRTCNGPLDLRRIQHLTRIKMKLSSTIKSTAKPRHWVETKYQRSKIVSGLYYCNSELQS